MSTTLTNGLKLPDKGSVDWYADMQSNYTILDGAVGTVAEHTSQIAGKASASHTHGNITNDGKVGTTANLPLITGTGGAIQAGSFGNSANTFCEGNDSRLSDARTPVAHTHTKSDVTDLFNSDNTWSGSNSFNSGLTINNAALLNAVLQNAVKGDVSTTGDFAIFIKDKVNGNAATSLLAVYRGGQDSGGSYAQINIDTKGNDNNRYNNSILFRINPADNSNNAVFIPQRDKTIDLGSSSYQWNNIYSKGYYYNGVAWGLDKANVWSGDNTFSSSILSIKNNSATQGTTPSSNKTWTFSFRDINDAVVGQLYCQYRTSGAIYLPLRINNGTYDYRLNFLLSLDGYSSFTPSVDKVIHLGTSTNKWATLNGINPGALSLPNTYTNIDTTNWNLTGTLFSYTPPIDGWLFVNIRPDNNYAYVALEYASMRNNSESTTGKNAMACIAVRANTPVSITLSGASIAQARLVTCAGNV